MNPLVLLIFATLMFALAGWGSDLGMPSFMAYVHFAVAVIAAIAAFLVMFQKSRGGPKAHED